MDKCNKVGALYVASLKALALIHQHNHWTTKGVAFYGDHLLFERLYNDTLKLLDLAAEKFVGLLGDKVLAYDTQSELLHKVLSKYSNLEGSPAQMSLEAVRDFIKFSKDAYNCFEEEGELTLGLDDMIMEIASKNEEFVYLLQQSVDGNHE
jgi:DNA-binding ferritin-like protein